MNNTNIDAIKKAAEEIADRVIFIEENDDLVKLELTVGKKRHYVSISQVYPRGFVAQIGERSIPRKKIKALFRAIGERL